MKTPPVLLLLKLHRSQGNTSICIGRCRGWNIISIFPFLKTLFLIISIWVTLGPARPSEPGQHNPWTKLDSRERCLAALLASVPRGPVSRPGHLLLAGFQRREKLRSKEKGSRRWRLDWILLCFAVAPSTARTSMEHRLRTRKRKVREQNAGHRWEISLECNWAGHGLGRAEPGQDCGK
jgi:hypothetical protein